MKAEQRVLAIEAAMAEAFSRADDAITGKQLREGEFREILKRHILATQYEAEQAMVERCRAVAEDESRAWARNGVASGEAASLNIKANIRALPSAYKEHS